MPHKHTRRKGGDESKYLRPSQTTKKNLTLQQVQSRTIFDCEAITSLCKCVQEAERQEE
jgi:hypothetical protein